LSFGQEGPGRWAVQLSGAGLRRSWSRVGAVEGPETTGIERRQSVIAYSSTTDILNQRFVSRTHTTSLYTLNVEDGLGKASKSRDCPKGFYTSLVLRSVSSPRGFVAGNEMSGGI
jgi:hypothetical protein